MDLRSNDPTEAGNDPSSLSSALLKDLHPEKEMHSSRQIKICTEWKFFISNKILDSNWRPVPRLSVPAASRAVAGSPPAKGKLLGKCFSKDFFAIFFLFVRWMFCGLRPKLSLIFKARQIGETRVNFFEWRLFIVRKN